MEEGEGSNGGVFEGGLEVRVLVVDDSPVERRMVEGLLKKSGAMFQVIAVDSGKRAMEVLGLTDDKAEHPTVDEQSCRKPIPVIIMSSENEPHRISRCRAIGAEDFILKPLQTNDVLRLRSYARPTELSPRTGTKRKMTLELMAENSSSDRRPRLTGLAVS
ncbi:hypothetical protein C4D60_Mb08t29310 [Musa balbisiana]|uniref:Response regulatory domain-containing protein n=1 Tax=Musa balbisiana TaxID=52838 RepID=A0A4S8K7E7_MUSBA|nr:hypothetical protein C4D60_Mb08t29310 [Musa balbisiana]